MADNELTVGSRVKSTIRFTGAINLPAGSLGTVREILGDHAVVLFPPKTLATIKLEDIEAVR